MPGIAFSIVLVGIFLAVIFGRRYVSRVAETWQQAGTALGLAYSQARFASPRLAGVIREMRVQVDVRTQRSGDNQRTYTRYRVWPLPPGFEYRLTRQSGLARITTFFGAQDVEVGDRAFDDAFVVKTNDEARLRALLDSGVMGVLMRTAASYPGVVFEHDVVTYEVPRLETSPDVIVSTVRRLVDTADALSSGRVSDAGRDIVEARARGELTEIARKMRAASDARAETLDQEMLELDTLATAGDRDGARERLRRLEETVPAAPEVVGWTRRLAEPAPSPAAGDGIDPAEVATEIFSGNALSFETKEIFDRRYRGASVRWTGRLKSVDRIHEASDLGDAGGDKLIATVATIDHDLYGNTDIDAVVGLPAGAAFGIRRGEEVTFTGRLVRVDALVRNLFVADGQLV